jgi:hypothetical protein
MISNPTARRVIRSIHSRLAATVLVLLVCGLTLEPPAYASTRRTTCRVANRTSGGTYKGQTALSDAIAQAAAGDTLRVKGLCKGNFVVDKALRLVGMATQNTPHPALDAGGLHTVLLVRAALTVTDLWITGGGTGGVVVQAGAALTLNGSTSVLNNLGSDGGGIVVGEDSLGGSVTMNDEASVRDNKGTYGGGVLVWGAKLTMNDSSSITGNTAGRFYGGGVEAVKHANVQLNDLASITSNTSQVGSGIQLQTARLSLSGSASITENIGESPGGGILVGNGSVGGNPAWNGVIAGNAPDNCNPDLVLPNGAQCI